MAKQSRGAIKRAQRAAAQRVRHLETCLRKVPFKSKEKAQRAALRLCKKGSAVQVYRCPFSKGDNLHWHYGNRNDAPPWRNRKLSPKGHAREENWEHRLSQKWEGKINPTIGESDESDT